MKHYHITASLRALIATLLILTTMCLVPCCAAGSAADGAKSAPGAATSAQAAGGRENPTPGDVNGDGKINAKDVSALMRSIVGWTSDSFDPDAADMTGDKKLNARDVIALMKLIVSGGEEPGKEPGEDPGEKEAKTLVLYFSATGTTKGVAERIARLAGADLKEIVPAVPYTAEDLDYGDNSTRATAEQNDPSARPQIAEQIRVDGYSVIYLGYPIWWGQAPRILSTFVESCDLTGVTVIPFCTSGSSDIGRSDDTLAALAGSGNWVQGRRFSGSVSDASLEEWIKETGGKEMEKTLHLKIDGTELAVDWEDNASVAALKELAADAPLTVEMSMYGGFEQVGSLGTSIVRNDSQTTTKAGDIVLYSGDQIVVFYGANSWAYTRLGHITDKSAAELADLLGNGGVTLTLSLG